MSFTPRSWAWWYGFAPTNAGRNEWWMLIARPPSGAQSVVGQDLHVAGEHDEVDLQLVHEIEETPLGVGFAIGRHRNVVIRGPGGLDDGAQVLVVRDHRGDDDRQGADAGAEQQVVEAVPVLRHEHEGARRHGRVDDLPGHAVRRRDRREAAAHGVERDRVVEQVEPDAHEEADGVDVLELRALHDVGAHVHEVAAHGVDEPGPVGAGQGEDAGRHRRARRDVRRTRPVVSLRGAALANGPIDSTIDSIVGRGPGPSSARSSSTASRARRIAARCSGEVPQQPPTMRAPASTARAT